MNQTDIFWRANLLISSPFCHVAFHIYRKRERPCFCPSCSWALWLLCVLRLYPGHHLDIFPIVASCFTRATGKFEQNSFIDFFVLCVKKKRKYSDIRWWSPLQSFKEIVVEQWLRLLIWRICTVKNKVLRNDFKCMWVICKSWFVFLFQHLWNCFSWTF